MYFDVKILYLLFRQFARNVAIVPFPGLPFMCFWQEFASQYLTDSGLIEISYGLLTGQQTFDLPTGAMPYGPFGHLEFGWRQRQFCFQTSEMK